jgi:hypothetical protein
MSENANSLFAIVGSFYSCLLFPLPTSSFMSPITMRSCFHPGKCLGFKTKCCHRFKLNLSTATRFLASRVKTGAGVAARGRVSYISGCRLIDIRQMDQVYSAHSLLLLPSAVTTPLPAFLLRGHLVVPTPLHPRCSSRTGLPLSNSTPPVRASRSNTELLHLEHSRLELPGACLLNTAHLRR